MSWLWFTCFVAAALYAKSLLKKLAKIPELEVKANQKFTEAETRQNQANALYEKARKVMVDAELAQKEADKRVEKVINENKVFHSAIEEIVNLWVNDSWKAIADKLTATNHATQKDRLEKVFETCRKYGVEFDGRQERAFYVRMETEWKKEVEAEKAREEQNRVREIMREEQRAEKVRAAELKRIEYEKKDLEMQRNEHLDRIKLLKEMENLKKITDEQKRELEQALAENAELESQIEEKERRKSMAEQTRAGNVYVISNIGSFGEGVFKIGMTRRLIPEERVKELSDASVPFPFDIHMMIPSEDAPSLETKLHEELWGCRINLVNDGKEFFKADLKTIKKFVDKYAKDAVFEFKPVPEAAQWRESEVRRKQKDIGKYDPSVESANDDGAEEAA